MNPTQNYGTTGMTNQTYPQGGDGGGYVLPPQNATQTGYGTGMGTGTGLGTGMGTHGHGMTGTGMGAAGMTGTGMGMGTGTGMGTGMGMGAGTGMQGVVGQQFVSPTVQSFAVSKKKLSVSKGDWNITDQTGATVFKVSGRVASMRDKRFLLDAAGAKILTMKKKVSSTSY